MLDWLRSKVTNNQQSTTPLPKIEQKNLGKFIYPVEMRQPQHSYSIKLHKDFCEKCKANKVLLATNTVGCLMGCSNSSCNGRIVKVVTLWT